MRTESDELRFDGADSGRLCMYLYRDSGPWKDYFSHLNLLWLTMQSEVFPP